MGVHVYSISVLNKPLVYIMACFIFYLVFQSFTPYTEKIQLISRKDAKRNLLSPDFQKLLFDDKQQLSIEEDTVEDTQPVEFGAPLEQEVYRIQENHNRLYFEDSKQAIQKLEELHADKIHPMHWNSSVVRRHYFNVDLLPASLDQRKYIIDVCISSDTHTLMGMVALIKSIIVHAKFAPILFHLIVPEKETTHLKKWLKTLKYSVIAEIINVDFEFMESKISVKGDRKELGSPYNFVRYFVPYLFPKLNRPLVYLDDDCIVRSDIRDLRNFPLGPGKVAAFAFDNKNTLGNFFDFDNPFINELNFDKKEPTFNAGVFVCNVTLWREQMITEKLLYFMDYNLKDTIYGTEIGGGASQPPMILSFYGKTDFLPEEWHVRHLGWSFGQTYTMETLHNSKLLHWNGRKKPWLMLTRWIGYWYHYYVPDPSNRIKVDKFTFNQYKNFMKMKKKKFKVAENLNQNDQDVVEEKERKKRMKHLVKQDKILAEQQRLEHQRNMQENQDNKNNVF